MFSCTDLTEEVFSEITEASYSYEEGDATKIVGASYSTMRNYFTMLNYWGESISSDEAVMPANASGWDDNGIYRRMHLHTWNTDQRHISGLWGFHYYGITLANRGIEQLSDEKFPISKDENRNQLVAELRALRALHYWRIMDPSLTVNLPSRSACRINIDFYFRFSESVVNTFAFGLQ
jgi:starch-binding outer membrane protein, SusD/RagB family